ncbi:alkane 1-monooxygenase [Phaeobacter sp. NW0010-22]|uniref:alkane 1-monooxygenase n=1 Tax=Phaeobacter sp. NW0010-22 TaxID=3135907 RepID=UPI0031056A91
MIWYGLATVLPAALIALACVLQGMWCFAALLGMTLYVVLMDSAPLAPLAKRDDEQSLRLGDCLTICLGVVHFVVLGLAVWGLTQGTMGVWHVLALGSAVGLWLGQVSNPNAHELIHRSGRGYRALGVAIYVSLLFGHHVSAHRLVHHVHVATDKDPNSAKRGEGFYRFWFRAWWGSFVAGWRAEKARRQKRPSWKHPYLIYSLGAGLCLLGAFGISGGWGVVALVAVTGHAQVQLLLADYVQHYGLRRSLIKAGRYEPVKAYHSWNAPHWYSAAMMLNAPHHSDHHLFPDRKFPQLDVSPDLPMLPYSMPVMAVIALCPPWWRHVMDCRLADLTVRPSES